MQSAYDPDFRYLEQLLHTMQAETFFRTHKAKQSPGDLTRRVRELEAEVRKLRTQYAQETDELLETVNLLYRRQSSPEGEHWQRSASSRLRGLRIAVVGDDTRHPVYRALIEETGAEAILVPGFSKMNQDADLLSVANGVIFVTAYSSHSLYYALKARRHVCTYVMVNRGGMRAFQQGLAELSQMIGSSAMGPLSG